jgi:hypothetical protein
MNDQEVQLPTKAETDNKASRAKVRRGRKPIVTLERVKIICDLLATGESEQSACLRAGVGQTTWSTVKRADASLRARIAQARDQWARLRHARHIATLQESRAMRAANRKAIKPQPTYQAKLVAWHLTFRVTLNYAAIPETEIAQACERFNLPLETWTRQERAFALMRKVYAKRAKIRGEQLPMTVTGPGSAQHANSELERDADTSDNILGVSVGL